MIAAVIGPLLSTTRSTEVYSPRNLNPEVAYERHHRKCCWSYGSGGSTDARGVLVVPTEAPLCEAFFCELNRLGDDRGFGMDLSASLNNCLCQRLAAHSFDRVVWRLAGDHDVVNMAFAQAGVADTNEARLL